MIAKEISIPDQSFDQLIVVMIVIKISGKKERSFYFLLLQCVCYKTSTFRKFMPGKNKCNILLCRIAADNSTMTIAKASFCGGRYFFGSACASFAANK